MDLVSGKGSTWHRVAPGQYTLRSADGVLIAIVERSALLPSFWWWEVFSERVHKVGSAISMLGAKLAVRRALESPDDETEGATK